MAGGARCSVVDHAGMLAWLGAIDTGCVESILGIRAVSGGCGGLFDVVLGVSASRANRPD
jgi:hypothetical protein